MRVSWWTVCGCRGRVQLQPLAVSCIFKHWPCQHTCFGHTHTLACSHSPPLIHRDLKSPNLLVDSHWTVKVLLSLWDVAMGCICGV